jgi:hypothetical protein
MPADLSNAVGMRQQTGRQLPADHAIRAEDRLHERSLHELVLDADARVSARRPCAGILIRPQLGG